MDEDEIFRRLKKRPETYRSLLGDRYGRNSTTVIVRRKILRGVKRGLINRAYLNGSRGGECLFFTVDKTFNILITSEHRDFHYYVAEKIEKKDKVTICAYNIQELVDMVWKDRGDGFCIFVGNIVKMV